MSGDGLDRVPGILQKHLGETDFSVQQVGVGCGVIVFLKFPNHFRAGNKQGVTNIFNRNVRIDSLVQLGKDDKVAFIKVWFYNSQTYHKLLKFVKENGQNIIETSSGKLSKHTATYGNYSIVLGMEQHIISRTSARTIDPKAVKTVDESYNEYEFTIDTGVEPWSKKIEKRAAKSAKRDAKGKKKRSVEEMM